MLRVQRLTERKFLRMSETEVPTHSNARIESFDAEVHCAVNISQVRQLDPVKKYLKTFYSNLHRQFFWEFLLTDRQMIVLVIACKVNRHHRSVYNFNLIKCHKECFAVENFPNSVLLIVVVGIWKVTGNYKSIGQSRRGKLWLAVRPWQDEQSVVTPFNYYFWCSSR